MTAERPSAGTLRRPRPPAIVEDELPGGLHAIAIRRTSVPLVEVRLAFPLRERQVREPAASYVLAAAMFAGTKKHDRAGLAQAVERLGGGFGAGVSSDRLEVYAFSLAAHLPELLALLAEVLTSAAYPPAEVEADRDRKADEVVLALSRPEVLANEALARRLYGEHPYATPMPRPEAILRIETPHLRRLHRSALDPSSAHLVVVGDVSPARVVRLATDSLGPFLESAGRSVRDLPAVPPLVPGGISLLDRPGAVQSNLRIGAPVPCRDAAEWPALALANEILGGMFTSRLVENLREKNGYTYSPHSGVRHARAGSSFTTSAEVGTDVTAASLVETRYELGRIATTGVSVDELEAARRYSIGSFLVRTATQGGLASTVAAFAVTGTGPGYLTEYPARIARTTKAEVDEAAARYLAPSRMATVIVGDASKIRPSLDGLDEVAVL
jgi:zinc protease